MENWLHQMTMVVRDIIHSFEFFFNIIVHYNYYYYYYCVLLLYYIPNITTKVYYVRVLRI